MNLLIVVSALETRVSYYSSRVRLQEHSENSFVAEAFPMGACASSENPEQVTAVAATRSTPRATIIPGKAGGSDAGSMAAAAAAMAAEFADEFAEGDEAATEEEVEEKA